MPEAVLEQPQTQQEPLGWRAGLPDDLKQNESLKGFKTVGEFAKSYLETTTKATELEKKLGDYVPKLPDNATDEDRNLYYDALGRPKTASEYQIEGEDKNAPEWNNSYKQAFHSAGLTAAQAKQIGAWWNGQMTKMVEQHNASVQAEIVKAEQELRSEYGDKYDANVELAKRMTEKHLGKEFDKVFDTSSGQNRFAMIKMLVKMASLTGEDRSPQAGQSRSSGSNTSFINYDKSPKPPAKH